MKTYLNSFILLLFASLIISCGDKKYKTEDPLKTVLKSDNPLIKKVVDSADAYEVQILFSTINRKEDNVEFTDYKFRVNDSNYFYPASSVKFPIAVLTLEKLNRDNRLNIKTPFSVEGDSVETTFEKEINKIFAVSDNDAYNRLFEYLGKDYINKSLHEKGISPVRISHRLSTDNAYELDTKPLIFNTEDSIIKVPGTKNSAIKKLDLNNIQKGIGYTEGDSIINQPMDFSLKNYLPINSLHDIMKRVIFPESFSAEKQFSLSNTDREFLLKSMSTLPKDQGYDPKEYYDSYVKLFMYGDKKTAIPEHIKIYNKVGFAYGYLTDCSYIHDTKNDIEFIVTATIHVNKNKIYNDGIYEYDEVGIPFLAELGRQLYNTQKNNTK
ncbi:serine hydrolase [Joostella atrarenae]|uniref:Serine hydrolase n=1 Tax=Joostella atrarenae TaxID=679257 RepID=A0ABS9J3P8_9FLAO|nr:serine hydrolase [Joostella atrarenae]MCF8715061.1 serine hydrolase [Joostella atrarenae]